jgi:chromosome segregation ATPase
MRQYETIDWKQYAQQQQAARRETEQQLLKLNAAFNKVRQMAQRILSYSRKLEAEVKALKLNIKHTHSMLLQQQETSKVLQQNNNQLRAANVELNDKLQKVTTELALAKKELELARQKLQFNDALQILNATSSTVATNDDLEQFFVYRPKTVTGS